MRVNLIDNVATAFMLKAKVVVLNIGGVIETASWKNKVLFFTMAAGQEGGILLQMFLK
jgi:beta-glucosidase